RRSKRDSPQRRDIPRSQAALFRPSLEQLHASPYISLIQGGDGFLAENVGPAPRVSNADSGHGWKCQEKWPRLQARSEKAG
ncbi:hypothetical protein, partial [Xanthomonas hortorum]